MKIKALFLLSLLLMGQDCTPDPDPGFCSGAEGVINYSLGGFNTIIGGELSTDQRAAVIVFFGRSYCSGNIVGKRTVLIAAHCGYGAETTHRIARDPGGPVIANSSSHKYHPDYQKWIDQTNGTSNDTFEAGGATYDASTGEPFSAAGLPDVMGKDTAGIVEALEGRKADLMFLYTDEDLPQPWVSKWYSPTMTNACSELVAQGYGRDEFPEQGAVLRESRYTARLSDDGKQLISKQATWGGSCFGDSGSCLYAPVGDDPINLHCAGVLSTTASSDCLVSANYVSTDYFRGWLNTNLEPS